MMIRDAIENTPEEVNQISELCCETTHVCCVFEILFTNKEYKTCLFLSVVLSNDNLQGQ